MQGSGKVPNGLWLHNVSYYLSFLAANQFNAIRTSFMDNYISNLPPNAGMVQMSPHLRAQSFVDVLRVIDQAARFGILVVRFATLDQQSGPTMGFGILLKLLQIRQLLYGSRSHRSSAISGTFLGLTC